MADDSYMAADERAHEARRAGLQAKKEEQPANTTRSYASKQREWKVDYRAYPSLPLIAETEKGWLIIISV